MAGLRFALVAVLALCVVADVPSCQQADETTLLQGVVRHRNAQSLQPPDPEKIKAAIQQKTAVAEAAWRFLCPLVMMAETRAGKQPTSLFHSRTLSNANTKNVVKPNVDTLYSSFWFDLPPGADFLTIDVPDTQGRFYVWQFMDMWSNTFLSLGSRTTGTTAQSFRLVGPGYTGPMDALTFTAPTRSGWTLIRILCNGPDDYPAVWALQNGFSVSYSSSDLSLLNTKLPPPPDRVDAMDAQTFFEYASDLMAAGNMPKEIDAPMVSELAKVGIVPGEHFDWMSLSSLTRLSLTQGVSAAKEALKSMVDPAASDSPAEWTQIVESVGNFSNHYSLRAYYAYTALGANIPADAFYPQISHSSDLNPLTGARDYTMTFGPGQLPPVDVDAFWSVTAYGADNYLIPNVDVYALGDRSSLVTAADGTTTIYLRPSAPEDESLRANWLPTPAGTAFSLTMRLYWPKKDALDGSWVPPEIMPH